MKFLSDGLFALLVSALLLSAPAHAYLDGATVSIALQALTGAVASFLIFGKIYWARFKSIFARSKRSERD